jgi:hypothetical protein
MRISPVSQFPGAIAEVFPVKFTLAQLCGLLFGLVGLLSLIDYQIGYMFGAEDNPKAGIIGAFLLLVGSFMILQSRIGRLEKEVFENRLAEHPQVQGERDR